MVMKPSSLFGRQPEWEALTEFVGQGTGAKLAIVSGRRRQGKTALLQAMCDAMEGFYWQALEQSSTQNLASFSVAWSSFVHADPPHRFASWSEAFHALVGSSIGPPRLVVLDEVGYLVAAAPEVPSSLQAALAPREQARSSARIVLCGSSIGLMRSLSSPQAPLRGRASLTLMMQPFDYRAAAEFWGLSSNPDAAFQMHALVGGTPAYRMLADALPSRGDIRAWAVRRLLDPRSPLFAEGRIAIEEDGTLADRNLYWGVLAALVGGASRRRDIAAQVGKPETALAHALDVLLAAGWIEAIDDPLRARRRTYVIAEPMVRFWRLVIAPNVSRLTLPGADLGARTWDAMEATIAGQIYAPHLERLAAEWLLAYAPADLIGAELDAVGSSEIRMSKEVAQVDLVGTVDTPKRRQIEVLGEVKSERRAVGPDVLARLDRIAEAVAPDAKRVIVARAGFTAPLRRAAAIRSDVVLADLAQLYA
jgi:uncharacterized protein